MFTLAQCCLCQQALCQFFNRQTGDTETRLALRASDRFRGLVQLESASRTFSAQLSHSSSKDPLLNHTPVRPMTTAGLRVLFAAASGRVCGFLPRVAALQGRVRGRAGGVLARAHQDTRTHQVRPNNAEQSRRTDQSHQTGIALTR